MNISYRWLREIVPDLQDGVQELADRLATLGAPVEEIFHLGEPLADITIARVAEVRRHPNADRLSLCVVEAGGGEPVQVVCGAPNVQAGAFYPFAPVGATLPGGMKIRKAKIRGETSQGMLCSASELGLGRDSAGILQLPGEFTPGESFITGVGLDDARLELEVTANRPDLLSHYGVAREVAPAGERGLRLPPFSGGSNGAGDAGEVAITAAEGAAGETAGVSVRIEDVDGCPRYLGAVVRGVRVGPSPAWLASRLRAVGLRPVNNVVDATNYVLHELGQPLHAFDLDRLAGGEVIVRRATAGERIRTLDGEDRKLDGEMLVIADRDGPVAVAGVMGGEESEVGEETRDIFLECALFDPLRVRGARRSLGLSTDASYRFERGVDPEGMERALRRSIALIRAVAGGDVDGAAVDVHPAPREAPLVEIRPSRAERVLGISLTREEVEETLAPLGFEVRERDEDALRLRVPGHRWSDVTREADLIEEVARRHGYDRFPDIHLPFRPTTVPDDPTARFEDRLRERLVGRGFLEARSLPLSGDSGTVTLDNPLSSQEDRLRGAIAPGLLRRVEHNLARGIRDVRLFEIGTVFLPDTAEDGRPREARRVAAVLTGARTPPHWSGEAEPFDLWDAKALLGSLAGDRGISEPRFGSGRPDGWDGIDPGHSLHLIGEDGSALGVAGQMAEDAIDTPAWSAPIWLVEMEVEAPAARELRVTVPPTLPPVERDLALLVPDGVTADEVGETVRAAGGALLESIRLFDLYRGEGVAEGVRSLAWRLLFRAPDRTLTDAEVDGAVARVLEALQERGVHRR
jgi:phenylalanyl-tRNA synthetase beta chain